MASRDKYYIFVLREYCYLSAIMVPITIFRQPLHESRSVHIKREIAYYSDFE